MRARFAEFVLDDREKRLSREGCPVHLTPKAYAFLEYLVRQGQRAVPKSEILQRLWPATFVSQAALTSVVKELRHALGDSARAPQFVRGVRGFGYAFCSELQLLPEPANGNGEAGSPSGRECRVLWQTREITLSEGTNLLGRTHEAAIWVDDASVSRRHALIRVEGRQAAIEDCGSKNGTFVGGERVRAPRELATGDELWLGRARLVFLAYDGEASTGSCSSEAGEPGASSLLH
jgi:DNA-binding winged helix-turn-helix (wHTH) protein